MITGWKKMDKMKTNLGLKSYLVHLVLILIIMFCIPYMKDIYDLGHR